MGTGTDATYVQASNYREQGGARDVIGGELDVVSGGDLAVESGGTVTVASGGKLLDPITTGSTASNFPAYGGVVFGSTAAKTYTLDTPTGGELLTLRCTAGTTSALQTVQTASTATTFDGTKTKLVFNAADDAVILRAESATRWAIYSNVGTVVTST